MDTFSVVTGVLLFLIFIFFLGFANYKEKSKQKIKIKVLNDYAAKQGVSLSESANFKNLVIGLDKANAKLCFVNSGKNIEETIELKNFDSCKSHEVFKNEKTSSGVLNFIDKIELVLYPKNAKQQSVRLEFYDEEDVSTQLSGELQFAQKWAQLIDLEIKNLKN